MHDVLVKAWAMWGDYLESIFVKERQLHLGVSAITCYLHACRHQNESKSRKYLAKVRLEIHLCRKAALGLGQGPTPNLSEVCFPALTSISLQWDVAQLKLREWRPEHPGVLAFP